MVFFLMDVFLVLMCLSARQRVTFTKGSVKKGTRLKNQGQAITTSLTDVIGTRSAAYFIGSFSCCNLDTSSHLATQEQ